MESNNQKTLEINLIQIFSVLWHKAWILILAAVLCGSVGVGYAKLQTPIYRSRVSIMVNNTYAVETGVISSGEISVAVHLAQTYIVLVKSDTILNDVLEATGLNYTTAQLKSMVSANVVNDTEIFEIYVSGTDPNQTRLIANAFLEVMPDRVHEIAEGSSLKTVDRAILPGSQTSPNVPRTTFLFALIGIFISAAIIMLLEVFSDKITDEDYLIQTYDLPILASIPSIGDSHKSSRYKYGYYKK